MNLKSLMAATLALALVGEGRVWRGDDLADVIERVETSARAMRSPLMLDQAWAQH